MCVALRGASSVLLTDYEEPGPDSVMTNLATNLKINGMGAQDEGDGGGACAVAAAHLDWMSVSAVELRSMAKEVDFVLAADVVYEPAVVPGLVRVLAGLILDEDGISRPVEALVAATLRNPATLRLFLEEVATAGLAVVEVSREVSVPSMFHVDFRDAVYLYYITRPTP